MQLVLTELEDCIPSVGSVEEELEGKELAASIDRFLKSLVEESRNIFVRRYFYLDSVREVADRFGVSESKVKSLLFRGLDDQRVIGTGRRPK